jgi:hypothetical protein
MSVKLPDGRTPPLPGAVRLVFEYQGQHVRLLSRQALDMTVMPSDPLTGHDTHHGFWVEVRDANDRPMHRIIMPDPTTVSREIYPTKPGESLRRLPVSDPRGMFVVLIPNFEQGHHVTLMGAPESGDTPVMAERGAMAERGRFPLTDDQPVIE